MLDWVEVVDGDGNGPAPLALLSPIELTGVPEPGALEADCAAGLLAGREGGIGI